MPFVRFRPWCSFTGYYIAADLFETELLTKLVRLNKHRVAEAAAGVVHYLRPSYQAPSQ